MADGALSPAVVDMPIGSLNQRPPDHAGPTGRLTSLYDVELTNYSSGGDGKRLQADPRRGFSSFSAVLRNSVTSAIDSGGWTDPQFLYALGEQLLSITAGRPRVWNGSEWTNYGTKRIVTQKLSESVLHATDGTIAAPDSAWIAGVTCSVWTQQQFDSAGVLNTALWIGFRADDGAWVKVPQVVRTGAGASAEYMLGKVVQDGSSFWVFYDAESSGHKIFVDVYDIHGVRLASSSITRNWNTSPGYWDPFGSFLTGVYIAQPAAFNASPTDVHVNVKKLTQSSGVITVAIDSALSSAHCMGPVAWLTNDQVGTRAYLATVSTSNHLYVYEVNASLAQTHEYDTGVSAALLPDSITGWVEEENAPDGNRSAFVSYAQLSGPAATTGPTFDPATRFIKTIKTTFAGVNTTLRTTHSVIHQSRAFAIESEYYAYTYYQSGSGQSLPLAPQSISIGATGDFFIGAPSQKLSFPGGGLFGAPIQHPPTVLSRILANTAIGTFAITGTDTVAQIASSGIPGMPDGTQVLKWTFANLNSSGHPVDILKVNASSIPSANAQWDIVGTSGTTITYTAITSRTGTSVTPGTFTATGTMEILGTTQYWFPNIDTLIPPDVMTFFAPGGTVVVSGDSIPANNGTFTLIARDPLTDLVAKNTPGGSGFRVLWASRTVQVTNPVPGTAVINPSSPNTWFFGTEIFTGADTQSTLVVSDDPVTNNNGNFPVASAPGGDFITTSATETAGTTAQFFSASALPTVSLDLNDPGTAYTLSIASVTFDYTYIGARVSIAAAYHSVTNGVYEITDIISAHVVKMRATNGKSNQRSEAWSSDISLPTVSIQRSTNTQPQTQPTWFVTPLSGSQPQIGCFEKGLAFADWRFDGQTSASPDFDGQNRYRFALSSTSNPFGTIRQVVLPYRVTSFTQVSIATVGATPIDIANTSEASTVGLKIFRSQGTGQGVGDAGKLLVPGLLATEYTRSGFAENNVNVGPEAPFVVSQGTDAGAFALTPKAVYTYQVVIARTMENGDVIESLPSPPIQTTLTGTQNFVVLGGRVISPLNSDGTATSNVYGLTNHASVTYKIFRSFVIDGVPSTQLHEVTDPSNPNGLYASGTGSGFSFPDTFTWNFRDELPDAGAQATGVVYAGTLGQGIAPHFPLPPFSHATTWNNRRWVVGYDGAVWMSAELQEGEDPWTFPGFRYPFPEEDPAVCVVGFENYLFMLCAKSVWRIQTTELPNATLTSGAMPTPVKLPVAMGCSGFAVACTDFIAYSSSADNRQVWAITRDLANVFLSEPLESFTNAVDGMMVDGQQRLIVSAGDFILRVFDPVSKEWYLWRLTTQPLVLASYQGKPTYEDTGFVNQQQDNAIVDTRNAVVTPIALDMTFSSVSFAQVRAVKRMWETQIIGTRNGDCNINGLIAYPDDDPSFTTFGPTRVTASPMLLAMNPKIEDAGSFLIRIFGSYEGISPPGRCFSVEMLSFEVGLDQRQGLRKLPNGLRLVGT